jgi:hypothetical protein
MKEVEVRQLGEFVTKHESCYTTIGKNPEMHVRVSQTGIGTAYIIKCWSCKEEKNVADVESW